MSEGLDSLLSPIRSSRRSCQKELVNIIAHGLTSNNLFPKDQHTPDPITISILRNARALLPF